MKYPVSTIEDLESKLHGREQFTKLDMDSVVNIYFVESLLASTS